MDEDSKPREVGSNLGLGLAPAYLADGQAAYAAGIVAGWPRHNQARFRHLLFTGAQLEAAVAAERERQAKRLRDLAAGHQRAADMTDNSTVAQRHDAMAAALLAAIEGC